MKRYNRLSKNKVTKIIRCFCLDIEASKTAVLLVLNRKRINRYYTYFREQIFAYQEEQKAKFIGTVEVDESYFGRTRPRGAHTKLKRGRVTTKQPVFGIFERGGRVYTEIVPDAKKRTLQRVIRGQVDLDTVVMTAGAGITGWWMSALISIIASANTRMAKHALSKMVFTSTALRASGLSQNADWPSSTA